MADIFRGNTSLSTIYRGQTELSKVYRGQTEVWSAGGGGITPVTDGLYNYFDIANASSYPGSGTTVTNIGVTGTEDGTLNGDYTYTSPNPYVGVGDGSTDGNISRVPDPVAFGSDFSLEIGFRFTDTSPQTNQVSFMNVRNASTYQGILRPGYFLSNLRFVFQGVTAYTFPSAVTSNWTYNNSYQLAVVVSGTNMKVYVNAVEEWSTTVTSLRPENDPLNDIIRYGSYANGSSIAAGAYPFDFYYWRDYSKALSPTEVLQNYNANKAILGH